MLSEQNSFIHKGLMAFRCELEGLEGHMGRENIAHPENPELPGDKVSLS